MELIVVLAVIALAVGLVAPAIGTQMPSLALRAEARQIAHVLGAAQARALKTRHPVGVTIDLEASRIAPDGAAPLMIDRKIGLAVTSGLGAQSKDGARFVFFPDGTTTGGRIALNRKGHEIHIEANWLTGHVRTFRKPAKL